MRYVYFALTLCFAFPTILSAGPGDTTLVQAHYDKQLPSNGNYDTSVTFPNGSVSYRKVYMMITLGKYQCPGNPQYCGDWDYMAQTYVMTPGGDTIEVGRLITPYANASYPRTPWGWRERYYFDVTDYYPVLKNNATIRLRYSGYTGGFTADIKFVFVEGTPERDILGVSALWRGDFAFGSSANPIESKVSVKNRTAPAGTQSAAMKFIVTGHRSDNNGCSEFCSKYYQVLLNGGMINQTDIWRDDCGLNRMYPQSGTWIYNRGNWCPGDLVKTNTHILQGITAGANYTVDVDFEPYTSTAATPPYYAVGSAVVYYGGFNKTLDASLEDIISPSNYEGHFRENPLSGEPVIRVRNSGSNPITSLKITYGLPGNLIQHTWTGTIAPLGEVNITLPEPPGLRNATGNNNTFSATIDMANNQADADATNNTLKTVFTAAPRWANKIIIRLKTNLSQSAGVSETDWKLYSPTGALVAQRTNNATNTQYADTLSLTESYYKLVVSDEGCDGLNWWANPSGGTGTLIVRSLTSATPLPLNGYFTGDFGCGFTQYFYVDAPTSTGNLYTNMQELSLQASPNPASDHVDVVIKGITNVQGILAVYDITGRLMLQQQCNTLHTSIPTTEWANGMYKIIFYDHGGGKLQQSLLIAK